MAIKLPSGISVTSKQPIDVRILLSKDEMLNIEEARMPDKYFALCKDDGELYVYDSTNSIDSTTGKFRLQKNITEIKSEVDAAKKDIENLDPVAKSGNVSDLKQSEGDTLVLDCNNAKYEVYNDGKYYTSIQEAINDSTEAKIELTNDIDLNNVPLVIAEGKKVELVLDNHTIKNADKNNTIVNKGNLVISGTGILDNISNKKATIYNDVGAKLTLNNGVFTRSLEDSIDPDHPGTNSYYTIKNYGELIINDNVVVNQGPNNAGKYSSLITNGWYDYGSANEPTPIEGKKATLTINGGKFSGGLNVIKNDDNSELIINGGEFDGYTQCVILNVNELTINGGTFRAHNTSDVTIVTRAINKTVDKGITQINGGIFEGNIGNIKNINSGAVPTTNITGGTFTEDISSYVKAPYVVSKKENLYIVSEGGN